MARPGRPRLSLNPPICASGAPRPATSAVTGRVAYHDTRRRPPLNALICRHFSLSRRLRSGATESCPHEQRQAGRETSPTLRDTRRRDPSSTPPRTRGPPVNGESTLKRPQRRMHRRSPWAAACNPGRTNRTPATLRVGRRLGARRRHPVPGGTSSARPRLGCLNRRENQDRWARRLPRCCRCRRPARRGSGRPARPARCGRS